MSGLCNALCLWKLRKNVLTKQTPISVSKQRHTGPIKRTDKVHINDNGKMIFVEDICSSSRFYLFVSLILLFTSTINS